MGIMFALFVQPVGLVKVARTIEHRAKDKMVELTINQLEILDAGPTRIRQSTVTFTEWGCTCTSSYGPCNLHIKKLLIRKPLF